MDKDQSTPIISVVMAVYNGEALLARAVDSLLAQTMPHFELIIIDDGSTDTTPQMLQDYVAQDSRIQVITNETNIGLTRSLNRGIGQVRGQYIARQDVDDVAYPQRFEQQLAVFSSQPDVALVSSHFDIVDDSDQPDRYTHATTDAQRRWAMLFYNHISGHSGVMLRAETVRALGGYDERFIYAQDYDLWVRLIANHAFVIIPEPLFQMSFHGSNLSITKADAQKKLALDVSQRQLEDLIGSINRQIVRDLHHFWIYRLDEINHKYAMLPALKNILRVFIRQQQVASDEQHKIKAQIQMRLRTLFPRWQYALIMVWLFPRYSLQQAKAVMQRSS